MFITILFFICSLLSAEADEQFLGDQSDGSYAEPVHLIPLYDSRGYKILKEDELFLPFSTKNTCGDCHNYDVIKTGWHFNYADANIPAGRAGQPWIYVDADIITAIPVTYRNWPGAFRPEQVGISYWDFISQFGTH
jgi:hypothetical protein